MGRKKTFYYCTTTHWHDNLEPIVVALTLYIGTPTLLKKYSGLKQLQLGFSHGANEKQQHIKLAHRYTYILPYALGSRVQINRI